MMLGYSTALPLLFLWLVVVKAGKDKSVKKRPVAVSDPMGLRSLDDWNKLGRDVLTKSCKAANLPTSGTNFGMASRLFHYYATFNNPPGEVLYRTTLILFIFSSLSSFAGIVNILLLLCIQILF